jgi:hypothetical protein
MEIKVHIVPRTAGREASVRLQLSRKTYNSLTFLPFPETAWLEAVK